MSTPRDETPRDQTRHLPLPRWATTVGSVSLVAASLVFVAAAKLDTVQMTYAIDALVDEEEALAEEQRRLRAELAEVRSPRALEPLALTLGLLPPKAGQVIVVAAEPTALDPLLAVESAHDGLGGAAEAVEVEGGPGGSAPVSEGAP